MEVPHSEGEIPQGKVRLEGMKTRLADRISSLDERRSFLSRATVS